MLLWIVLKPIVHEFGDQIPPPPKGLGFEPWLSGAVGKELPGKQKKNTGVWLLTGQSEAAINDLFCGAKAHKSHLKTAP